MNDKKSAVIEALLSERDYQDSLGETRTDGRKHGVAEELVLMKVYLSRAFEAWSDSPGDNFALEQIRKVAGIAFRCMENHGAPPRNP